MKLGHYWAVAGLALVAVACGGPEDGSETGELSQAHENECRDEEKECVWIEADQNITHVFLDFKCDPGDFKVTLETDQFGKQKPDLHEQGGPCQDIERDFWFPVPGPDQRAKVCVKFKKKKSEVKVSYKAANVCEKAGVLFDNERCQKCEDRKGDNKDDWKKGERRDLGLGSQIPQHSVPGLPSPGGLGDYRPPSGIQIDPDYQFPGLPSSPQ